MSEISIDQYEEIAISYARCAFNNREMDLVSLSIALVLEGVEAPSLLELAALSYSTPFDQARALFMQACAELGLPKVTSIDGWSQLVRVLMESMLAGKITPNELANLCRCASASNPGSYDDAAELEVINAYALLWDEYPEQRASIESGIVDEALRITGGSFGLSSRS